MKFYHSSTSAKWRQIKKLGFVASPEKLLSLGLLKADWKEPWNEATSSGEINEEFGLTKYVFGTPYRQFSFGNICLEFDIPEEMVIANPVGEHLHWLVDEPDYYFGNRMPGVEFTAYWQRFQKENLVIPQPFEVVDGKVKNNLKKFYRHFPELMVEGQVPLTFLVKVHKERRRRE